MVIFKPRSSPFTCKTFNFGFDSFCKVFVARMPSCIVVFLAALRIYSITPLVVFSVISDSQKLNTKN